MTKTIWEAEIPDWAYEQLDDEGLEDIIMVLTDELNEQIEKRTTPPA